MKNYIRILTMVTALMWGAVSGAWAQLAASDVEIEIKPSASAGTIEKSVNATTREVTLTVTPASGYYIKASDIIVEKLVDPGKANAPKRRISGITDDIVGKMYTSDMSKEISTVEGGSSAKYVFTLPADYDGAYVTATFHLLTEGEDIIRITASTDLGDNPALSKHYILVEDIDASVVANFYSDSKIFTGTFDGDGYTISGLTHPLFNAVNGGVVKNVMLRNVHINQSGNVGAITGEARGYTRIYNCGILPNDNTFSNRVRHSSVASTDGYCGGLVGLLKDNSRVINCFSYANVNGGTDVAGIVGYNNYASTAEVSDGKYTKLKTAVVNCMFYGNITGGTNRYPVYGGKLITNAAETGISSYNYYSSNSSFNTADGNPTKYNCSFPAEVRYLTQVEFHRSLLNSNRELCGWWVGSNVAPSTLTTAEVQAIPKDASLMYKWVIDPNVAPYPILKPFGRYASVINGNTGTPWVDRATANPYEGKQLGTLTVTVNSGSHSSVATRVLSIPITDMDTLHYDFGYRKIQLPYYNTVFGNPKASTWEEKYAKNYTDKVVTGWKITAVTGGTPGTFDNSSERAWENGYNFADRKCTNKDLYSVSGRVFAQGGYYYVPDGVTAITIEAYWGKAIYVRNNEASYDRVNITLGTTGSAFAPAGTRDNNVNGATIQTTSIKGSLTNANIDAKKTVYDYALVLVGNVQESVSNSNVVHATQDTRGFTIMSVDLDFDEEPDYCLEWQLGKAMGRQMIAPIRFDFLPVVELGIAGKRHNSTNFFSLGCFRSKGHFEVTETAFIHFGQFEFELGSRDDGPIILNGGIYDQYCRGRNGETNQHINYVILGGHVVMPSFTPGAHVNNAAKYQTRHCAVNALGGDFNSFYLTGGYNEDIVPYEDNPHCYIDGGRFGTIAAAYKEGIWGDVTWRINHAIIREFYGGGVMSQADGTNYKIVKGNIDVVIDNSIVGKYCGGPKFGDMVSGKTVTTSATGTIFNQYFGAGNGGTNYVQYNSTDVTGAPITDWSGTISTNYHPQKYRNAAQGYEADYDIEIINSSTGDENNKVVNRSYYYSAQFATTNTGNVTSTLTDCTINTNFYGGGFLGGVTGDVTSTLNNCTVAGSVFGAGYSASAGTISISNTDKVPPVANTYTGIIKPQKGGTSTTYYWTNDKGTTSSPITAATETDPKNYFYTEVSLDNLGTVSGNVILNINGTTTVGKSIYGGGEESGVGGNTEVSISGGIIGTEGQGGVEYGNVYGGGKGKDDDKLAGLVKGNTSVTFTNSPTIYHNVYGGGAYGSVGDFTYDTTSGMPTALATENTGKTEVIIKGGTFGTTGKENGMVFGSSRGDVAAPGADGIDPNNRLAWVYSTHVTIGDTGAETSPTIKGSVYGSGENGHTFTNTKVDIVKGTIGITASNDPDGGARYPYRGNVYGGGCGTDTYTGTDSKTYYNPLAGVVWGNATVNMTGGHVVHNVYGAGAMGSVGKFTYVDEAYNTAHSTATLPIGKPYLCAAETGLCTVSITGGKVGMTGMSMTATGGPDDYGHVFGAGRGDVLDPLEYPNIEIVGYVNNTAVTIGKTSNTVAAFVTGSVYGGSESGHVLGDTEVTISGGQIGCGEDATAAYTDWSATSMKGTAHWTYTANGAGAPYDKFSGTTGYDSKGGATTATDGHTFYGNVFGGGSGYYPYAPGKWLLTSAGRVEGTATVTITDGHILNNVYGGCEMADILGDVSVTMTGGTVGVPRTKDEILANPTFGNIFGAGMGDKRIFFNTSTNVASSTVSVSNGTVYGSVYGGGEDGHVLGTATTTISQPAEKTTIIGCDGTSGYDGNVFGGGQGSSTALTAGVVGGNVSLEVQGGTLSGSVYGGGRIASVGTYFAMATDPRYGKMQDGDDHGVIAINLTGGTINQNVFGGCMGTIEDAALGVSKNVTVKLNENGTASTKGCIVKGDIFGCNNVNSSPQGDVTVHIYATQNANTTQMGNTAASGNTAAVNGKTKGTYDVHAVYGGGNLAAYKPVGPNATLTDDDGKNTTKSTKVIIDGCGLTSIETVYGGGNAASTPATEVTVNGTFEINELFGGGNGYDALPNGDPNPGANVGFYDYSAVEAQYPTKEERASADFINNYTYGTGKASVNVYGGTIHRVFGGSNTKGNVRQTALTLLDDNSGCEFCVDEAYGGGKSAPMDAEAKLLMACIPGLRAAYGGAEAADVQNNVILNITNGTFDRVFGGNNLSGTIRGSITVNVEETGCKPIKIGELYGGGNQAAYSVYGYKEVTEGGKKVWKPRESADDSGTGPTTPYAAPQVNVKSFTSIGDIYGGGLGTGAVMVGNPTVNINVALGKWATEVVDDNTKTYDDNDGKPIPSHKSGKIGAINNVFGGGNAAKVIGAPSVNIGTTEYEYTTISDSEITVGTTDVSTYYTRTNTGSYEQATGVAQENTTYYKRVAVVGADIRGNVYGGGNNAEVTGNTNVTIGKENAGN